MDPARKSRNRAGDTLQPDTSRKSFTRCGVAFFPSDHYFSNDMCYESWSIPTFSTVETEPQSIVLLRYRTGKGGDAYGWIEPGQPILWRVVKNSESRSPLLGKADGRCCRKMVGAGCLWKAFMVGKIETFLDMFRNICPTWFRMFAASTELLARIRNPPLFDRSIRRIDENEFLQAKFSKNVSDELLVMCVGKSAGRFGRARRVVGTLMSLGVQSEWMQRSRVNLLRCAPVAILSNDYLIQNENQYESIAVKPGIRIPFIWSRCKTVRRGASGVRSSRILRF